MKQPYQKMKNAELRELVAKRGLDMDIESATRGEMVQALKDFEQELEAEQAEKEKKEEHKDFMAGRVRLIIPNQEGALSKRPVFVGVNGQSWHIPRDKEVVVPKKVVNALRDCRESIVETDDRGNRMHRAAQRIPFTVLETGPDE